MVMRVDSSSAEPTRQAGGTLTSAPSRSELETAPPTQAPSPSSFSTSSPSSPFGSSSSVFVPFTASHPTTQSASIPSSSAAPAITLRFTFTIPTFQVTTFSWPKVVRGSFVVGGSPGVESCPRPPHALFPVPQLILNHAEFSYSSHLLIQDLGRHRCGTRLNGVPLWDWEEENYSVVLDDGDELSFGFQEEDTPFITDLTCRVAIRSLPQPVHLSTPSLRDATDAAPMHSLEASHLVSGIDQQPRSSVLSRDHDTDTGLLNSSLPRSPATPINVSPDPIPASSTAISCDGPTTLCASVPCATGAALNACSLPPSQYFSSLPSVTKPQHREIRHHAREPLREDDTDPDPVPPRDPSVTALTEQPATTGADSETVAGNITLQEATSVSASVLASPLALVRSHFPVTITPTSSCFPVAQYTTATLRLSLPRPSAISSPVCSPTQEPNAATCSGPTCTAHCAAPSLLVSSGLNSVLPPLSSSVHNLLPGRYVAADDDGGFQRVDGDDAVASILSRMPPVQTSTSGPTSVLGKRSDVVECGVAVEQSRSFAAIVSTNTSTADLSMHSSANFNAAADRSFMNACSVAKPPRSSISTLTSLERMRSAWMTARMEVQRVRRIRLIDIALQRLRTSFKQLNKTPAPTSAAVSSLMLPDHPSALGPHPAPIVRESLSPTPTSSRFTTLASKGIHGRSFTARPVLLPAVPFQSPPAYFLAPLHALYHVLDTIVFQIINSSQAYINNYQPQLPLDSHFS